MALSNLKFDSISKFAESIKDALHAKAVVAVETKSREIKGIEEDITEYDSEVEISFDEKDLPAIKKIADSVGVKYEVDDKDELTITDDDETMIDKFLSALDDAGIKYEEETVEDDIDESITTKSLGHSKDDLERMIEVVIKKRKKNEKDHSDMMNKADELILTGKEVNPLRGSLQSSLRKLGVEAKKIESEMNKLLDAWRSIKEDVDEGVAVKRKHTSASDKAAHKKAYRKNKGKLKVKAKRYRKTAHAKRLKKIGKRKSKQGKTATGRRIIKRV